FLSLHSTPPPSFTLFPYTTLFRSGEEERDANAGAVDGGAGLVGMGVAERAVAFAVVLHVRGVRRAVVAQIVPASFWKLGGRGGGDRKSTRLNSSHQIISYAVFCLK